MNRDVCEHFVPLELQCEKCGSDVYYYREQITLSRMIERIEHGEEFKLEQQNDN